MISIRFDQGTLLVHCEKNDQEDALVQSVKGCLWDSRTNCFRFPANCYFDLILCLHRAKIAYQDFAKEYEKISLQMRIQQSPFPYQKEAIDKWEQSGKRGVVVLPTGTGKSFTAILAIFKAARSALVVVPTIDLMQQWYDTVGTYFANARVGLIGGGYFEPSPITIITYDSAYRHLETLGNKFGLIIFDECHHLPSATYSMCARFSIAPYRLGLSATPERGDGGHYDLQHLIGPFVYYKSITEMSGDYLAEYDVIEVTASLSQEEYTEYKENRSIYLQFLREKNLRLTPGNWSKFIQTTSRSAEGKKAFQAYLRQKEIAQATSSKIDIVDTLISRHRGERIIIFTHDNAMAYKISRRFLVPIITHQTKIKERKEYINGFNSGKYCILATSKVLNEGVNIPAANIGIILSGSGSVREHVQRLGRILRKYRDKKATLYEIVTENTVEEYTSQRRREHEAYHRRS